MVGAMYDSFHRRAADMVPLMDRPRQRRVVVQAGGHVGIVPALLADRYSRVYTFEPELRNFAALVALLGHRENVWAARGMLGAGEGCLDLLVHAKSSGGHQIPPVPDHARAFYPCYAIDGLHLDACDAIFLDLEGYELVALGGAARTMEKHHPMLVVEDNKKANRYRAPGDLEQHLARFGYVHVGDAGEDKVFA